MMRKGLEKFLRSLSSENEKKEAQKFFNNIINYNSSEYVESHDYFAGKQAKDLLVAFSFFDENLSYYDFHLLSSIYTFSDIYMLYKNLVAMYEDVDKSVIKIDDISHIMHLCSQIIGIKYDYFDSVDSEIMNNGFKPFLTNWILRTLQKAKQENKTKNQKISELLKYFTTPSEENEQNSKNFNYQILLIITFGLIIPIISLMISFRKK